MKNAKKRLPGWRLYIVQCSDDTLYTGITNDIDRRMKQHNAGTASRYTRSRLPVTLLYTERCLSKASALKKEYAIKQFSRPEKEAYIIRKKTKKEPNSR
jgi:predicted GIY-YIG superfamily endonuclease